MMVPLQYIPLSLQTHVEYILVYSPVNVLQKWADEKQ